VRVFRNYSKLPQEARQSVVAIGNFDGVHRGHAAVIAVAAEAARAANRPLGCLTFEPHPRSYFAPASPPFRLTDMRGKLRVLRKLGVEHVFLLRFDERLAGLTPEEFAASVLAAGLDVRHTIVGYDFVFGRGRMGDAASLRACGAKHGFAVTSVAPQADGSGQFYSSTRIRELLATGEPGQAGELLGRPWEIEGRVTRGEARGRKLGFPTANLPLGSWLRPKFGVYAVRAGVPGAGETLWHSGVANIGRRPTFGATSELLEAHLFDYSGDLYGKRLRVQLHQFLRAERKFAGIEQLKAQIAADCQAARQSLEPGRGT
jgi:riboflavin kinase / FMN adenylyltransferase